MLELWFSNQDGSDGSERPSGAASDQVLGITSSAPLGGSACSHCPLPLPAPSPRPAQALELPKEAVQLLGPSTHLFWEKCLPSDLAPAQSLGLIAHARCTNE